MKNYQPLKSRKLRSGNIRKEKQLGGRIEDLKAALRRMNCRTVSCGVVLKNRKIQRKKRTVNMNRQTMIKLIYWPRKSQLCSIPIKAQHNSSRSTLSTQRSQKLRNKRRNSHERKRNCATESRYLIFTRNSDNEEIPAILSR